MLTMLEIQDVKLGAASKRAPAKKTEESAAEAVPE
jgi:hypothetical protein